MKTQYKYRIIVFLIAFLLGSTITYALAQSGSTFIISQGVYPSRADFTLWKVGLYYYVKNSYGLQPSWSGGTDASTIIQNAIDNGDSLFLYDAIYEITTSISLDNKTTIIGESMSNTVLKWIGGNDRIITYSNCNDIHIEELKFENNNLANYTIRWYGIGENNNRHLYKRLWLTGTSTDKGYLGLWFINNLEVTQIYIEDDNKAGASIGINYASQKVWVHHNEIYNTKDNAIDIVGAHNTKYPIDVDISYNFIHEGSGRGIVIEKNARNVSIHNNYIVNRGSRGIHIREADDKYSQDVSIYENFISNTTYANIKIEDSNATDGIQPNNINIYNNHLNTTPTNEAKIYIVGNPQNVKIHDNIGFLTENSGNKTGTSPITITHHLDEVPTKAILLGNTIVIITPTTDAGDFYVQNLGSTTFQIAFDGGGTVTFYWYIKYEP